jgi:hypothetical protein
MWPTHHAAQQLLRILNACSKSRRLIDQILRPRRQLTKRTLIRIVLVYMRLPSKSHYRRICTVRFLADFQRISQFSAGSGRNWGVFVARNE